MLYNLNMGEEVSDAVRASLWDHPRMEITYSYRDAIDQHRCFIFHCPRVDEWSNYGRKHSCKEILRWLEAAPDIKVRKEQLMSMNGVPKIALIFEDPIYAKLFSLHFNAPLEKPPTLVSNATPIL